MPTISYGFENVQSLIGIAVILLVCWLLSEDKKRFPFGLAIGAIAMQAALVLFLFAVPQSRVILEGIGNGIDSISSATMQGMQFVFGYMGGGAQPYQVINQGALFVFALQVLPLILVISALAALLWHWGVLKVVIRVFGLIFEKLIGLGGASALGVSSGIFLGNVESMILIRGYLDKLTRSELFLMIVIGMANVSGSTMVAYVLMLTPVLPHAAGHILAASIVSAPAGVLLARIMLPERPDHKNETVDYDSALKYDSAMDAITKGTTEGVNVVIGIASILIVMVALVALGNSILTVVPSWDNQPVTIERVLGILLSPLAWLIGIPWKEAQTGGYLLGVKMVLTEFVAYLDLAKISVDAMSPRTRIILTYALCGFANIASIGISVAGYSALIPTRRSEIIDMVWKGFLAAFLTTCLSAAVVGALPNAVYGL
jgi:concentrative nucleoside transporter, CNT family